MTFYRKQFDLRRAAFTLIEILTVLALLAVLLTAVLGMYSRVRRDIARLAGTLDENRLAREILQKVAEDIDRLAAPGFDATIKFRNKYDNGYNSAQLALENKYYGNGSPPKSDVYDRVVWQTTYDPFTKTLVLYRMHDGLNLEDKVIELGSDVSPSAGLFIPIADGITHFEIRSQQGDTLGQAWTSDTLPTAVQIGISFAPAEELPDGHVGVPEEKILLRTVAVDRTRFIPYQFVPRKLDASGLPDPNEVNAGDGQEGDTAAADASASDAASGDDTTSRETDVQMRESDSPADRPDSGR